MIPRKVKTCLKITNQFIEPYLNNLSIIYNGQKYVVNNYEYQDNLFRFIKITATLSIGEPLDLITDLLLQDSFILISQNEDNLIFQ